MLNRIICGFVGHKSKYLTTVEHFDIFQCSRCGELIALESLNVLMNQVLNDMDAAPYLKDRIRGSLGLENNSRD